jgi:hypothetical protein
MNATKIAYFDLDGTLADRRHRSSYYLPDGRVDWAQVYAPENVIKDPLLDTGYAHYQQLAAEGAEIYYLTARKERNRPATAQWLADHGFPAERLVMKPDTEARHGSVWKLAWLETLIAERGQEGLTIVVIDNSTQLLADLNRRARKDCWPVETILADWLPPVT